MTLEEIKAAVEKLYDLEKTAHNQEAKVFAYELLENPSIKKDSESLAKVYNSLGRTYSNFSDYSKALEYQYKSLEIIEVIGNKKGIATVIGNIGEVHFSLGLYDKALENTAKALKIFEEISDISGIARITQNMGNIYISLGSYEKALENYTKALMGFEELEDKSGISGVTANMGAVYTMLGIYDKAMESLSKSLSIYEELGHKSGIASVTGNIGGLYQSLGSSDKAIEYLKKALSMYEEVGDKSGIAITTGNIGKAYFSLREFDKALEYQKKALVLSEELSIQRPAAYWLHGIGETLFALEQYNEALKYLNKALQLRRDILLTNEGVADTLISISKIHQIENNHSKALKYLSEALELSTELGEKSQICYAHKELANLYRTSNEWEKADTHFVLYHNLQEEIHSNEAKKQADNFHIQRKIAEREIQMAEERGRLLERESILRNILPDSVTDRLVKGENPIADHFETASVLFMDLVGFTSLASIAPPKQLVYLLDAIFQKADEVLEQFGLEKIKTIGDGYLAVANVTSPLETHQFATAQAALQLLGTMKDFVVNIPSDLGDTEWIRNMKDIEIRIGIHTGEVVAGIIGKNKYTYDLWGDAVNIASRMESNSEPGRIHISEEFAKSIESRPEFSLIPRGEISIKGKGSMKTFWLEKGKM